MMCSLEFSKGVRDGGGSRGLIQRRAIIIFGGLFTAALPKCIITRMMTELRKIQMSPLHPTPGESNLINMEISI